MHSSATSRQSAYLPVPWEYKEVIDEEITRQRSGKVFFFNLAGEVDEAAGRLIERFDEKQEGEFIRLDTGVRIRIDRIITLFGKIGAAYGEYEAYANVCADCKGDE